MFFPNKRSIKSNLQFTTFFLFQICAVIGYSQAVQIGQDIDGVSQGENAGHRVVLNSNATILGLSAPFSSINGLGSGYAKLFQLNGSVWEQMGTTIIGDAQNDILGVDMKLNEAGNIVAIGAPQNDGNGNDSGQVKVFEFDGTDWVQLGDDLYGDPNKNFGVTICLSDDGLTMIVGAPSGNPSGLVKAYEFDGTDWIQKGNTIDGGILGRDFGRSLAMSSDGNRIAISEYYSDGNIETAGQVVVYEYDGTSWIQMGQLLQGGQEGENYGEAISMNSDGDILAIASPFYDFGHGKVRVYEFNGTHWVVKGPAINGDETNHRIGKSIALNNTGERLAIGAQYAMNQAGELTVYDFNGANWIKKYPNIVGEAQNDFSTFSIDLNQIGSHIIIGAPGNDEAGGEAGHARVFNIENLLNTEDVGSIERVFYPNPIIDNLYLQNNVPIDSINIYNMLGQILFVQTEIAPNAQIDLSSFSSGQYIIQIREGSKYESFKILKN